jgi:flagellar hook-length control protein FliK
LQLHPPELGYLQVQVQLTDNQLSAAFWADSSEVRALLQTHLPTLQQNLSTQSFPTHYVSTTLAGGDFSGQAGQFAQQHAASQSFAHDRDHSASRGANQHLEIDRVTYRLATRNGLLDVVI